MLQAPGRNDLKSSCAASGLSIELFTRLHSTIETNMSRRPGAKTTETLIDAATGVLTKLIELGSKKMARFPLLGS